MRIDLQPVGDVEVGALDRLSTLLARTFAASVRVGSRSVDAGFAYDPVRKQYYSTAILAKLAEAGTDPDNRVLGVTESDLFVPVLTFVFGEAQLRGCCAVVSRCRLSEEFYGLRENKPLAEERLAKESVHELGHTFGLAHCDDWRCVMASSHAVDRLDLKTADFCAQCRGAVLAGWPASATVKAR